VLQCLGHDLARAEIEIALRTFLTGCRAARALLSVYAGAGTERACATLALTRLSSAWAAGLRPSMSA
jgi:hypothetical protein